MTAWYQERDLGVVVSVDRTCYNGLSSYTDEKEAHMLQALWVASIVLVFCTMPSRAETIYLYPDTARGTFTMEVDIPGLGLRYFTLDTGASYSAIGQQDADALGLSPTGMARVLITHEGKRMMVYSVQIPEMHIGSCTLRDRTMLVFDFSKERDGVIGMHELAALSPFTFVGNGEFAFTCPD